MIRLAELSICWVAFTLLPACAPQGTASVHISTFELPSHEGGEASETDAAEITQPLEAPVSSQVPPTTTTPLMHLGMPLAATMPDRVGDHDSERDEQGRRVMNAVELPHGTILRQNIETRASPDQADNALAGTENMETQHAETVMHPETAPSTSSTPSRLAAGTRDLAEGHDSGHEDSDRRELNHEVNPRGTILPYDGEVAALSDRDVLAREEDHELDGDAQRFSDVLQALQGRGHEPRQRLEAAAPDLAARLRALEDARQGAAGAPCNWQETALDRLEGLRARGLGLDDLWVRIVRMVLDKHDARFEEFAKVYLRWLRKVFGRRYRPGVCPELTYDETEFARWIVEGTYLEYQQVIHPTPVFTPPPTSLMCARADLREFTRQCTRGLNAALADGEVLELGLRAQLHHQIAEYGDPMFATFVLVALGDLMERLDHTTGREMCNRAGADWCRWTTQGYWQHYCHSRRLDMHWVAPLHAPASTGSFRSRSRTPPRRAGHGRSHNEADAGHVVPEDSDEGSFLHVEMLLPFAWDLFTVAQPVETFLEGTDPDWFTRAMQFAWGLYHGGAEVEVLTAAIRQEVDDFQDPTFSMHSIWFEGHVGQCLSGPRIPYECPRPAEVNIRNWARDAARGLRAHFHEQTSPVAMANAEAEREARRWGIDHRPSPGCYELERMERARLDRSRTPQRRDRNTGCLPATVRVGAETGHGNEPVDETMEPQADEHSLVTTARSKRSRSPRRHDRRGDPGRDHRDVRTDRGNPDRGPRGEPRGRCTEEVRALRPRPTEELGEGGGEPSRPSRDIRGRGFGEDISRAGSSTDAPSRAGSSADAPENPNPLALDGAVETWRYLLQLTNQWPPPPVISAGGALLSRAMKDEIIEYMRGLSQERQVLMTLGFVHLLRFLMVEISEACHMASVLSQGGTEELDPNDEVEVEVDETGYLQVYRVRQKEPATYNADDEATFVQLMLTKPQQDKWHRLLVKLQKELAGQSKAVRGFHVKLFRARLFRVVNVDCWSEQEDQLYALLIAMDEKDGVSATEGDTTWLQQWSDQLQEFIRDSKCQSKWFSLDIDRFLLKTKMAVPGRTEP